MLNNIYEYITSEENAYTLPIDITEGYSWSMKNHINTTVLYKNSKFGTGNQDDKPFKNIIKPILNLNYRAEGFDVKDVGLFVNHSKKFWKSFLVRKFHEKWAVENKMDDFIDNLVETWIDFGGVLIKKVKGKPEVVKWESIAFCDQTDILSGPIGIKHFYSPDQLLEMKSAGWGEESNGATISLEDLVLLAQQSKTQDRTKGIQTKTPGKYIEVYEIHGTLPKHFLDETREEKYISQFQIVAFYQKENGEKEGVTLFSTEEKKSPFKFLTRDAIYGRALGLGGAEELFEPQVWTNYSMIRKKDMLDAASKTVFKALNGNRIVSRHPSGMKDLENMEIVDLQENEDINQIDTFPRNYQVFDSSVEEWEAQAQTTGAAGEAIMGDQPPSGTPFRLQQLVTQEAHSLHEYRKGKLATFVDELYREWIIPEMKREILKDNEFIASLTLDEVEEIADTVVENLMNKWQKERILNLESFNSEELTEKREEIMNKFRKGNQKFVKIVKDEFRDDEFDVKTNVASKQKDVAGMVDKMTNVIRYMMNTYDPNTQSFAVFNDPRMMKLFNQIMENSGLSPIEFSGEPQKQQPQPQPQPQPQQQQQPNPKQQQKQLQTLAQ